MNKNYYKIIMEERDIPDEENPNEDNAQDNYILAQPNSESEDEKSNEEENQNLENNSNPPNPMNSFLNIVNQVQQNKNNERNENEIQNEEKEEKEEDGKTLEEKLLLECQKEDEENEKKIKEKELEKKLKRIKYYNFKDYFLLFALFISTSFYFNYLSIYYVLVGQVYLVLSENLNRTPKKIKYFLEIFTLGSASYVLLFKIIIVILFVEEYSHVINNLDFYMNLGVVYIHNQSIYYLILTFSTEVTMILFSGYGLYVSFICRTLEGEDIKSRKTKNLTIKTLILMSYVFVVLFSLFNISYLTLLYIVLIQFCLLISSLKVNEEKIKKIFKFIVYGLLFLISIQILLINIFNIPNLQGLFFPKAEEMKKKKYY